MRFVYRSGSALISNRGLKGAESNACSHYYHNNMANGDERNAYNERLIDVIERERLLWDLCDQITSPVPSLTRLGGTLQQ
ncbi:hypothetical protein MRX96_031416 [Rhipicephalus microplus]